MDPFFVIAKLDLARYYDQDGNTEKADQLFQEALEVHPDSFDGHIHYGEFLYEKVRCLGIKQATITSQFKVKLNC